ncbi:copper chaperone PCu(A)C [Magnetospirillum sp. LM-5]|uniref:copper chaperone PCu(A)C n=1 Tax=Magnetospirillum sp. LM-5 TaxID=2681466 RepID=UPI00157151F1|nr:copper chaperone PCu(A)C [Magnetospirillum sp. LM-5]
MKLTALTAALLLAVSPAFAGDMEISGAFLRASPKVANAGAGFLTIKNATGQDDRLIGAQADISKTVELHTHIKDGEVLRMRPVEFIAVPAGGVAELKPGADHVMFINLVKPLAEGQKVPVTLVFEKAGKKQVDMPVMAIGTMAAPAGH